MSKYEVVINGVQDVLDSYSDKLTLRQIYYRLVSKHIIPNMMKEYKKLSRYLVKAREEREIDWRRIEDRARTTHGGDYGRDTVDDIDEYIQGKLDDFKNCYEDIYLSRWYDQDNYVEIWIEKDALSRLASNAVSGLNVMVCPSKGYSSFTYIAETVSRLHWIEDKDIHILYFGDFDPSGLDIERDLYDRLVKYGVDSDRLQVTRHALTSEQIEEYQLPPFPAKTSDTRYAKFVWETGSNDAVELDALEPPILSQLIRDAVLELIDWDKWNDRIEKEDDIKERIKEALEEIEIEY